jgi:5-methylcytosine-specific restriction endonuclease McrA
MGFLNKTTVLVLNRNWQAIHIKTPTEALSMMYCNDATGLDIKGEDNMIPYKWDDWINLPYESSCDYISTVNKKIKIPKVIVLCHYDKVPIKRPKFSITGIWTRDNGICQYTGRKLSKNEGNIDHIIPKSRGGKSDWTNCVLAHKEVNALKADKTLEEVGLKLLKKPTAPKLLPVSYFIRNNYNIKEWEKFLIKN